MWLFNMEVGEWEKVTMVLNRLDLRLYNISRLDVRLPRKLNGELDVRVRI